MNRSFGSFLPMNTRIDCFFSPLVPGLAHVAAHHHVHALEDDAAAACPSSTARPCSAAGPGRRPGSCRRGTAPACRRRTACRVLNTNDSTSSWCSWWSSVRNSGSSSRIAFRLKPRMSSTLGDRRSPKCTFLTGARGFILRRRFDERLRPRPRRPGRSSTSGSGRRSPPAAAPRVNSSSCLPARASRPPR